MIPSPLLIVVSSVPAVTIVSTVPGLAVLTSILSSQRRRYC